MLAFYLSLIDNEIEKRRFEEAYYTYRKQMFALADSILKNKYDAEDVVHDVFCSVASSHMNIITETENEKDVRNYLLKSVKNTSINLIKKRKIRSDYEEEKISEIFELSDNDFLNRICSKMECESLVKAMDLLDEKYREVLYYYFVLDLSASETAELLARDTNTVRKQISRGKELLLNSIREKEAVKNVNDKK